MEKVRAFLATYRVWPQADMELERELAELVDDHEQMEAFEAGLVEDHRLDWGPDTLSNQEYIERAVKVFAGLKRELEQQLVVDVEGSEDPNQELREYIAGRDKLEVFRSLILGLVKKAGALDMKAFPDDFRLVILVEALFP